jgi:hypothetical protein
MRVVRMRSDRLVEVLGECDDFAPPKVPGDVIQVAGASRRRREGDWQRPEALTIAAYPVMRYRVRGMWRGDDSEAVVEIEAGGPHPCFLPGWRAAGAPP